MKIFDTVQYTLECDFDDFFKYEMAFKPKRNETLKCK